MFRFRSTMFQSTQAQSQGNSGPIHADRRSSQKLTRECSTQVRNQSAQGMLEPQGETPNSRKPSSRLGCKRTRKQDTARWLLMIMILSSLAATQVLGASRYAQNRSAGKTASSSYISRARSMFSSSKSNAQPEAMSLTELPQKAKFRDPELVLYKYNGNYQYALIMGVNKKQPNEPFTYGLKLAGLDHRDPLDASEDKLTKVKSIAGTTVTLNGGHGTMTVLPKGRVNDGPITLSIHINERFREFKRLKGLHGTTRTIQNAEELDNAINNFKTLCINGEIVGVADPYSG